jgi:hypothetical protein
MGERQTGNQDNEGQGKITVVRYGGKLWRNGSQRYECENEKEERREVRKVRRKEAKANYDIQGKGN